jgi:hypothetical protein
LLWILASAAQFMLGLVPVYAAAARDFSADEEGRPFRVRFDPASEVRLGLVAGASGGSQRFEAASALELGILYRSFAEFGDKEEDRITWQLDHRFLTGRIQPGDRTELDMVAYSGSFLRHSAAPYMVLPTDPPQRFYFPFDVGVEARVGRVRLDPKIIEAIHRVAPFTAVSVRWRLQDQDGLTRFDLRGDLTPHWASVGSWQVGAEAVARFERVLIAVNDEPVALVLEAGYERLPPAPGFAGFEGAHEFTFLAGLAFGFQLK